MQPQDMTRALEFWPPLARVAGVRPDGWAAEILSARNDAQHHRIVLALSCGEARLVLKRVFAPVAPDAFREEVAAQREAHARGAPVPEVLAEETAAQAVLMRWADGVTLFIGWSEHLRPPMRPSCATRGASWRPFTTRGPMKRDCFSPDTHCVTWRA